MSLHKEELLKHIEKLVINHAVQNYQQKCLLVKTAEGMHKVNLEDIIFCEANNSSVSFYLTGKRNVTSTISLKKCQEVLISENGFFRVHKSYIVNLFKIQQYNVQGNEGMLNLDEGYKVKISRQRKKDFHQVLRRLFITL